MQTFITTFLKALKNELGVEILPLSRAKEGLKGVFIIYEISNEELFLSIDNKILSKELEINLSLYAPKYKDLRELKQRLECFVLNFGKKPIEILASGEEKDEESGFFTSEVYLTYRL